ncbi:D-alanyl-D-alanine carboxypeptidase family protein [uncultured Ruminococcus sp.]|uniref:D-alanyl-D-alanine carboxypeptidase family protein n=1 Tax=uncultured Ruminococcus sp. TaxID=165186 RepID=UPI002637339E|nr:D-alanyl-D-alanine carboxypeptidase family protein [uncultured Ruminococcus sp.]
MAKRSKDGVWERFSRTGVILVLLYVMFIILGFAVRLLFFSDERSVSIIPDNNNVIASAEGTAVQSTDALEMDGNSEATNANILELKVDQKFLAVLEGNTAGIAVNMSTTGQASAGDLVWSSSDESVATVDASGTVTGVKQGKCDITVAVKGNETISRTVPVTVRKLEQKDGCTYIDGILMVNKTYGLPESFDPGQLDATARAAFEQLKADAAKENLSIYIGSDYRDYQYQVTIYNNYSELYGWEMADTFSARPGHSEHQTGLTIDCNSIDDAFGDTQEAAWLAEHCADYGFIVRFPEGKEDITGYKYEPWHIRYVGVDTAKEINSLGLSLEEYLGVDSVYTTPWEG